MTLFHNSKHSSRRSISYQYIWMACINGLIATAISFYALIDFLDFETPLSATYIFLQQIGHFQFFAFIIIIPALFLSLIIPSKRLAQVFSSIIFSAFILIVFIDYSIFQLYKFHINGMVWNMLTGGALTEIFVFDMVNIITVIAIISIIIISQLQFFRIASNLTLSNKRRGIWVFLFIFCIQLGGQLIYAVSSAQQNTQVIALTRFIPLPQPVSMNSFLYKNGWVIKTKQNKVKTQATGRFNYPLNPMQCKKNDNLPNIVFIVVDGLRHDMVNEEVMPNWHELSSKSQVFNHHISTGNATRFGIFGLFSGLFSNYWFDALNTQMHPVLITELVKNNYQFGFFANARLTSPEFDQALFSQVKQSIPAKTEGESVVARDYKITEQSKDFFKQNKNTPFFSFIFYDAPHAYQYPQQDAKFHPTDEAINYLKLSNDSNAESFLNRYKNAVHFNDRLTGELIKSLENNQILDNSIIILTGDHGQEANETKTNSWGHNSNFSKYQIQVPLMIYWPNKPAQTFNHLTSHADVVPSLMQDIFKCSNPFAEYSSGQSLFNKHERDFVLVNNWNNQALVNKDTIREFHKIRKPVNHMFENYKILNGESSYLSLDSQTLKANSQFYH